MQQLCRQYRVAQLYLFGSAVSDRFRPMTPHEHRVAYFSLVDALEFLFQLEVDFVKESAIRNPYFRNDVEEIRVVLYAA